MATYSEYNILPAGLHTRVAVDTAQAISVPKPANGLIIQAEVGTIRYTIDGSTATATNGFRLTPTDGERRLDLYSGIIVSVIGEAAGSFVDYIKFRPLSQGE